MAEYIMTISSIITALGVILGVVLGVYRFYIRNTKQDEDIKEIKEEQKI